MDPVIDNDWLGCKKDPIVEPETVGNIARSWQWRERGINPPNYPSNKTVLENVAEDILVQKPLKVRCCDLPGSPRSTFLMVFSSDGTKVASTHGNHNVYVSELATGKHVRVLQGHPRTPWCITFHPSHTQLIASGCLGGQVRVWDISNGGSEVWFVPNQTVVASIAFHPRVQLLVVATYNDIFFWDWSKSTPFAKVSTNNLNEKVRYVAFDALGYKLITGISSWSPPNASNTPLLEPTPPMRSPQLFAFRQTRREESDSPSPNGQDNPTSGPSQDVIVNSYHNLVQRYDSLVRSYRRLFMFRHRMSVTPPPPTTTDRGTDPMETDSSPERIFTAAQPTQSSTSSTTTSRSSEAENPTPSTSRRQDENDNDTEGSSSRLLNLDVLSFDNSPEAHHNISHGLYSGYAFGSLRPSAFQPFNETAERTFRTVDQSERSTRLLPNPFSTTSGGSPPIRLTFGNPVIPRDAENSSNTSRTSIFSGSRSESYVDLTPRRRRLIPLRLQMSFRNSNNDRPASTSTDNNTQSETSQSNNERATHTAQGDSPRFSSFDLLTAPEDSQSITESLDLIRDILRDSGSRLVDLITRVSLSTLVGVGREENFPNNSDDSDLEEAQDPLRRDLSSTSSDSDSDHSLEVNIFRTPNATFREEDRRSDVQPGQSTEATSSNRSEVPTDRLTFNLNNESRSPGTSQETGGFNMSSDSSRFRIRSNLSQNSGNGSSSESRRTSETQPVQNSDFNPNRPSTSRDSGSTRGASSRTVSEETYKKVRAAVLALQKHTVQLTDMWLHGNTISLRELRYMWENLRRRILTIHRENNRQETPSYYTRSLLERCRTLDEMTEVASRTSGRSPRGSHRTEERSRSTGASNNEANDAGESSTSNESRSNDQEDRRNQTNRSPQLRRSPSVRSSPPYRRRLLPTGTLFRWRHEEDLIRRPRIVASNRLSQRYSNRTRRDYARAIEITATRHEIRMRAMEVLSVMFNSMMLCLEERGLSQVIINMLRLLKKALALTCLMLMTTRESARPGRDGSTGGQRVDSQNVIRIQNIDHMDPINVDDPEELLNNVSINETKVNRSTQNSGNKPTTQNTQPDLAQPSTSAGSDSINLDSPLLPANSQRWSNRLAVQIAAANRNNSITARNRRDLYIESRRLKALHRTNPTAHPLIKKRVLPPVTTHRIPALRLSSSSLFAKYMLPENQPSRETESRAPAANGTSENSRQSSSSLPPEVLDEFDQRINLIRLAHMQAVRLRNAARSRFRRLQTIRLYTPSSVREMFSLQGVNAEHTEETRPSSQNDADQSNRRHFTSYDFRSRLMGRDRPFSRATEETQFHTVFNNVAMPLMQINNLPTNEVEGPQPQRPPRIHEYLQPIILAQNAMVVDEDGNADGDLEGPNVNVNGHGGAAAGGGGENGPMSAGQRRLNSIANLLDSGIISEAYPSPAHRIQAWDFTTGDTPDISDSTKNIVVSKCRIHNDASIDISKDGRILVALLPVPRIRNNNHWLGVYSLEWSRLGQCLHTAALEQSAVSVALSPTARHLAVGLGSRRFSTAPHAPHAPNAPNARNVIALLYCLDAQDSSGRTSMSPVKELEQNWEHGFRSLNCLRWAPQPGQGFVYANNTGQLVIMS